MKRQEIKCNPNCPEPAKPCLKGHPLNEAIEIVKGGGVDGN